MESVTLKSSFAEILGKSPAQYTEVERKSRWEKWKQLAMKKGEKDLVESWSSLEACHDCAHINKKEAWCNLQGLPCCVNPILSFQLGMVGMACMGTEHTKEGQQELEFSDNDDDLPF